MTKRALTVGINNYGGISDLQGCVNDVTNMRDILRNYLGFLNDEIRVLTDERATKEGILTRLEWLVREAKTGDFLIFHFSGHGSQIRDRDGDERLKDGMDELICPYDFDWDGTYIMDDDLNSIFRTLPKGVLLEVFLDSCHSGTGIRDISFGRPADLGPENPSRPRYLPPPVDISSRHVGEEDKLKQVQLFKGTISEPVHHILWSGCRADQTSADAYIDNAYNGAFTYYFCHHMRRSNGNISRKELLSRIRASLNHGEYSQVPQLETEATVHTSRALTSLLKIDLEGVQTITKEMIADDKNHDISSISVGDSLEDLMYSTKDKKDLKGLIDNDYFHKYDAVAIIADLVKTKTVGDLIQNIYSKYIPEGRRS